MFQGGEMMNDTFMKEKPVLPLILSMTLPMVFPVACIIFWIAICTMLGICMNEHMLI